MSGPVEIYAENTDGCADPVPTKAAFAATVHGMDPGEAWQMYLTLREAACGDAPTTFAVPVLADPGAAGAVLPALAAGGHSVMAATGHPALQPWTAWAMRAAGDPFGPGGRTGTVHRVEEAMPAPVPLPAAVGPMAVVALAFVALSLVGRRRWTNRPGAATPDA